MKELANPQICQVSGNKLNYFREGQGETVLLVHGITTYSFIWAEIFHLLKSDFDVIAVDLLGCGDSDKSVEVDYSLKNQVKLLKEFIDALNIQKVHFVGHDVGGGIAQIFTIRYPESVISSTFINTVAYDFWPVQPIIAMRTPIIRQLAMATLDMGMFKLIVQRGVFHKEKVTSELMNYFFKPMQNKAGRKAFLHFAACLDNKNLIEITGLLKKIETPVLIVRGDADVYLGSNISKKLHSEISISKLVIIPDAGHFIQLDEPEKLAHILQQFIKEKNYAA
jgi:pimeloyl-ACP methyl ester carboxylesterase